VRPFVSPKTSADGSSDVPAGRGERQSCERAKCESLVTSDAQTHFVCTIRDKICTNSGQTLPVAAHDINLSDRGGGAQGYVVARA
jgi:hypothetical protein